MERRNADYKLLSAMKAFEVVNVNDVIDGTSGNLRGDFEPHWDGSKKGLWDGKYFWEAIDAPMLLARLCAGFKGLKIDVGGQEDYKVTWTTAIRHVSSGTIVTFYDYKGAASFGGTHGELPKKVQTDIKKLLLALTDARFPHPYDGCVVGEVA